eukprot:1338301-Amorphochlora_amoeboformis.AAC.1
MFRVCEKFNHLFVRPRIQAAIREYQQPLIETVKDGINKLHEKFKMQYVRSEVPERPDPQRDMPLAKFRNVPGVQDVRAEGSPTCLRGNYLAASDSKPVG